MTRAAANALNLTGSGSITAKSIGIVGNFNETGSGTITPNPPTTGISAVPTHWPPYRLLLLAQGLPRGSQLHWQHGAYGRPSRAGWHSLLQRLHHHRERLSYI